MRDERATEILKSVAANVRRYRQRRGLTQAALAEAASLDLRAIQRIETGTINVGVLALVAIAEVLEVPLGALAKRAVLIPLRRGRPTRRSAQPRPGRASR
jgi:transcriptional regulator with XRE-family HTH domain